MEPLTIALTTAFATKAFEEMGKKTGENVLEKATELVKRLYQPEELITLNLSADHLSQPIQPSDPLAKLDERLTTNPNVAQQLITLLEALKAHEQSAGGNFGNQTNFGKIINNVGNINEVNM